MTIELKYNKDSFYEFSIELLEHWQDISNKVFVLRPINRPRDVKTFFSENFKYFGKPYPYGENAEFSRGDQGTGSIWSEVRNDDSIPNAYRHSTNAQPLHTDGSYIPGFPSSTLMLCVNNKAKGGETIFLDSIKLYEILESDDPTLLKHLLNKNFFHERSGYIKKNKIIQIIHNQIHLNWNWFCLSKKHTQEQKVICDQFFNFLKYNKKVISALSPIFLNPGDAVFWRDNLCLHGRNSFTATNTSDRFLWKAAIDIGDINKLDK